MNRVKGFSPLAAETVNNGLDVLFGKPEVLFPRHLVITVNADGQQPQIGLPILRRHRKTGKKQR
jgi:hypothetical protein